MKKKTAFLLAVLLLGASASAYAGTYTENMKHTLIRGVKNILTGFLEIPITIQEYHEQAGKPFVRHAAGFVDGTFQAIARTGSGIWDLGAAFIPGGQEGLPVKPETLF
ncbi:MAG TPA: hypothetical protein VL688_01400 [Verrucomicrobiae bacterium]|jgi:putative exosortase-associated protein (TIGR04073 family)|nr:hypothetical protein [Verrucomicrobiae bacterium]